MSQYEDDISVRASKDYETLSLLRQECFSEDEHYPFKGSEWWIAKLNGKPVGFGGINVFGNFAFLCLAGVLPRARGKRIHRKLLTARIRRAKVLGLKTLITYTTPNNIGSINNLIRCGFVTYTPEYAWVGAGFMYWWKDLQGE